MTGIKEFEEWYKTFLQSRNEASIGMVREDKNFMLHEAKIKQVCLFILSHSELSRKELADKIATEFYTSIPCAYGDIRLALSIFKQWIPSFSLSKHKTKRMSDGLKLSCPKCNSTHIISKSSLWRCDDCGKSWNKVYHNRQNANRPNHPCPRCKSIHVGTKGKLGFVCYD
jgi:hypothetical protein